MARVEVKDGKICVRAEAFDLRAKQYTVRSWNSKLHRWELPLTPGACKYVISKFASMEIDPDAVVAMKDVLDRHKKAMAQRFPHWYKFRNKPMAHQMEALNRAWGRDEFALFMEMGTGKTFVAINWAAAQMGTLPNYGSQPISAMLVVCPTAVKPVWPKELKEHCPIDHDVFVIEPGSGRHFDKWLDDDIEKMRVLVVGVEALSQGKAFEYCRMFLHRFRSVMVVDESSRIKTPQATRTKRCWSLGALACKRMILTGTPVTQGMHDLFAQFYFLDPDILGHKSYFTFQHEYCVMGGYENRQIIGYRNVPDLMDRISDYTYIIKKEDVLDLPPKIYETLHVTLSPQQKKVLAELGVDMFAQFDNLRLDPETMLEVMTRYQQVVGGLFPYDNDDGTHGVTRMKSNPKLTAMVELLEDMPSDKNVIIWARFVGEQRWIVEELRSRFGKGSVVWYSGGMDTGDRTQQIEDFQSGKSRFFVSSPSMGGIGLTLTRAEYVIYYSNSFSLEDRLQSEDRAHRKGQTKSVTYVDIVSDHDIDKTVVTALRNKKEVADYVSGEIRRRNGH